jgi:histidinol phosphatase-like enzyme
MKNALLTAVIFWPRLYVKNNLTGGLTMADKKIMDDLAADINKLSEVYADLELKYITPEIATLQNKPKLSLIQSAVDYARINLERIASEYQIRG